MDRRLLIGYIRLIFMFLILLTVGLVNAFIVHADGCSECWMDYSNEYGTLSVYPRICHNAITQKQYWNLEPDVSAEVDIAFRFDDALSSGGLYFWNGTTYNKLSVEHVEYGGYHYYVYWNLNVVNTRNYSGYWIYNVPMNTTGKWDLFVKLSSDPIGTWRIHLDPYWDSDYGTRVDLYVNASQVDGNLENFPVRVYINGSTHMYYYAQSDLDDVVFVNTDNDTVYNFELVNYSRVNNKVYANYWVNITDVSSTTNTHFNMYYNNTGASSQEDAENTWDSHYTGVYHFEDSSGGLVDSTSYGNDFDQGDGTPVYQQSGICGYGVELDGVNEFFENNDMNIKTYSALTIEAWHSPDVVSGSTQMFIFGSNYDGGNDIRYTFQADNPSSYCQYIADDGVVEGTSGDARSFTVDKWYYFACAFENSGVMHGFWDDTLDMIDGSVNFNFGSVQNEHRFGCRKLAIETKFYDGTLDEYRISDIKRSDNWLTASYRTNENYTDNPDFDPFIIWGNIRDFNYPPTLVVSNIFPADNSYWCNNIINLTNLSVHVECPYGDAYTFELWITFLDEVYFWHHVSNGTYNVSLPDKIPIGTTNYTWILNISSNYCVEIAGYCFYNDTLHFDVCWGALNYMAVDNLDIGSSEFDTAQFFILLMFISWIVITLLNYIDINRPEVKRNKLLGIVHVLFSAPLIFYFAYQSFIGGLIYGYLFTGGFIITMVYIVAVQSLGD